MNEKNDNGLAKKFGCEKKDDTPQQQTVMTNMGEIPIEDYREIVAQQNGFDSYEDMCMKGIYISDSPTEDTNTQKSYDRADLSHAINTSDIDKVKEIIASNEKLIDGYCGNVTPLHNAVFTSSRTKSAEATKCVDELLKHGVFVDALDVHCNTPLYYAVEDNNCEIAKKLLKAGANPELKNGDGIKICDCVNSRDMKQLVDSYSIEEKNSTHKSLHLK